MDHRHLSAPGVAAIVLLLALALPPIKMDSAWAEGEVPAVESTVPEVRVLYNPEFKETSYRIQHDGCVISWTVHASDMSRGMITHRADCKASLAEQATLMAVLLEHILADHPEPDVLKGLSWGRIAPDFAGCTDMSLRLSLAAAQSSSWDRRRGKPAAGHVNHFVELLAEQQQIYAELADLFTRHGRRLRVDGVEKVLILRATDLPCYETLKMYGVRPDDKLPFDCQLWLAVEVR